MVESRVIVLFLAIIFMINCISAFCYVQGEVKDDKGDLTNASKINLVCKRQEGEIVKTMSGGFYAYPFGGLGDDCSYCNEGVYVNAIHKQLNLYAEIENKECIVEGNKVCEEILVLNPYSQETEDSDSDSTDSNAGGGDLEDVPYYNYNESEPGEQEHRAFNPDQFEGVENPVEKNGDYLNILIFLLAIVIITIILWRYKK